VNARASVVGCAAAGSAPRDHLADHAAVVLVAVCLAWAVFAVASAPRWAACITAALCAATVIPYVTSRRKTRVLSPLLILIGLAFCFTLVQIIPLPAGLVAVLSPSKHALLVDNAAALGESAPTFMMLSYDPPATLVQLAKLAGYLGFAYTCLRLSASSRGRIMLVWIVCAAGGACPASRRARLCGAVSQ